MPHVLFYPSIFSIPHTSLIPHNYLPNPFPTTPSPLLFPSSSPFLVFYPPSSTLRRVPWFSPSSTSLRCTSFPLIPSQRPPDIGVSVIPPYVISGLILSRLNTKKDVRTWAGKHYDPLRNRRKGWGRGEEGTEHAFIWGWYIQKLDNRGSNLRVNTLSRLVSPSLPSHWKCGRLCFDRRVFF